MLRYVVTWEINRGFAGGASGGNGVFVLAVRQRVREEWALKGIEWWWSEKAFGGGETEIDGGEKGGEEVEERETEEFWLEDEWRWELGKLPHLNMMLIFSHNTSSYAEFLAFQRFFKKKKNITII